MGSRPEEGRPEEARLDIHTAAGSPGRQEGHTRTEAAGSPDKQVGRSRNEADGSWAVAASPAAVVALRVAAVLQPAARWAAARWAAAAVRRPRVPVAQVPQRRTVAVGG